MAGETLIFSHDVTAAPFRQTTGFYAVLCCGTGKQSAGDRMVS